MKAITLTLSFSLVLSIILTNLILVSYSPLPKTGDKDRARQVYEYIRGNNVLEDNYFSIQAKSHLEDVKDLFTVAKYADLILIFAIVVMSSYLISKKKVNELGQTLTNASLATIGTVAFLSVLTLLNFDYFFVLFHKIIFRNDNWLFNPQDNLVKLFPLEFFVSVTSQIILNIVLTSIVLLLVARLIKSND